MEIIKNKALVLRVRNPKQITAVIPKSKELPNNQVVVYWDLDAAQVLRNLRIKNVPSPILGQYDWPGQHKPFDHQKTTAAFLTMHTRAFCLNEQGTGKTGSVIWAADYLMKQRRIKRVLVICPLSIMDSAWRNDLFKFAMHRSVDIAYGSADKRRAIINGGSEFVIINYDGVEIVEEDIAKGGFDLIVVDEANAYKNVQTKRWKVLNRLVRPDTWLWMLTGTPAAQSPLDAYGLAKLVNPNGIPKFFSSFRDQVMIKLTNFRWVPKENATHTVFNALQPAIRFTKDECLDLPEMTYVRRNVEMTKQQQKYYDLLKKRMVVQASGEEITAVNAAVNMNKLMQIACIAYNTEVLTEKGWIPIQNVTDAHKVWDGVEWVAQGGAIYKGFKPLIMVDGVRLTSDHKVWVGRWVTAKEILDGDASGRFNRPEVRTPDGFTSWDEIDSSNKNCEVGLPVRLWEHRGTAESVFTEHIAENSPKLRVLSRKHDPQHVTQSPIRYLVKYAEAVQQSYGQGLQKLRRAWDNSVQGVGRFVRSILDGYGGVILTGSNIRQNQCKWPLRKEQLSLGYTTTAVQQQTREHLVGYPKGANDHSASGASVQHKTRDFIREAEPVQMAADAGSDRVYDLINCGPRNRFVVRGNSGTQLIVHNCGAVYSDTGETLEFDISKRYAVLTEVIDESSQKVLIFVPFKHVIKILSDRLTADGYTNEVISGDVSASQRADIFKRFQETPEPRVLVIQPQAAAHGVTLTAANTVVWWAPTPSLEIYAQANARVHRSGQRHPSTVVQLAGSGVEKHVYALLDKKIDVHSKVVDLYKEILE